MQHEHRNHQPRERGNGKQPPTMSLGKRAEKREMRPGDGQAEANDSKTGKYSYEYRKNKKENFFMKHAFKARKQAGGAKPNHRSRGRYFSGSRAGQIIHRGSLIADYSLNGGLTFLGDQQKRQIECLRLSADRGSLLLDLKDNVHDSVREIGFSGRAESIKIRLGGLPTGLQTHKRRHGHSCVVRSVCGVRSGGAVIWNCRGELNSGLLGAFNKALLRLGKCRNDKAIPFSVGNMTAKGVVTENQVGGR